MCMISVGAGLNNKCMENNNCDEGILCIQELDPGNLYTIVINSRA